MFRHVIVVLALTACQDAIVPGGDPNPGSTGSGGTTMPPPDRPPVTQQPATYKRGSLQPLYQLTPRDEYGRFIQNGVQMQDSDFISTANNFVSAAQKMDEIGGQIAAERGAATTLDLVNRDRDRAVQVPFRGNPSDVKVVRINGLRKAYVPLGGDLMAPGNEVASVDLATGAVTRIKVGIRPQRVAVHPDGLVFVCNQFSNYISIIDPRTDRLLSNAQGPIEIKTEYYCTDLAFVPRNPAAPNADLQDLYVANSWRSSVLQYGLTVTRDPLGNTPVDVRVTNPAKPSPENQPAAEITGVGSNPYRLSVSQDQRAIYVANNRGGELARLEIASKAVNRIAINAPVPDIAQANDIVVVPTTTIDRGLPDAQDPQPTQISAPAVRVTGLDKQQHVAHPGALFDHTKAYNFEDMRNGLLTIDAQLPASTVPTYFTDDISAEPNFTANQKVLAGSLPQAIAINAAHNRAYLAMSGSDNVQVVSIQGGIFRIAKSGQALMRTAKRPFALTLDEAADELLVAAWGGEVLQTFSISTGALRKTIDLGYANAPYPATNMERGEYLYYNTAWSNNGRKSCATCHFDELLLDGIPYANGATAPTAYHKVPSNWNLLTTNSYFWNGSFGNGTYASLASDAQTRTNCELIAFGETEGIASNPATRVGDPANRVRSAQDTQCRPDTSNNSVLPANFAQIQTIIAADHLVRDQVVKAATAATVNVAGGLGFEDVARLVDFYSVSELRLPPNPLAWLSKNNLLGAADQDAITRGKGVFQSAGCINCHDANNQRHPFTDGQNHGSGTQWLTSFINTYGQDPRILAIGGIPSLMSQANVASTPDKEINIHLDPIDFFEPFCFDLNHCLVFDDPLAVRGNRAAEDVRLDALIQINLANVDRGFVPGNVRGQPLSNTPSLRGIWYQSNFLRHGLAHTFREAVLAPGHPALGPGELGFAIDALGNIDVHGATSKLSSADLDALFQYVQTLE
jgi:DNA-binding beta-propeller fold protein YncE/cytochrome c peroxidase